MGGLALDLPSSFTWDEPEPEACAPLNDWGYHGWHSIRP
jgi:hypothetical protein